MEKIVLALVAILIIFIVLIVFKSNKEGFDGTDYSITNDYGDVFTPRTDGKVRLHNLSFNYKVLGRLPTLSSDLKAKIKENQYKLYAAGEMLKFDAYKKEQEQIRNDRIKAYYDGLAARTSGTTTMTRTSGTTMLSRFTTMSVEESTLKTYNYAVDAYEKEMLERLRIKKAEIDNNPILFTTEE